MTFTPDPGVTFAAPAKINLFLHVTGRRADGYHELETIFQFLDLADGITLRLRRDGRIRRVIYSDPMGILAGVPEEKDLAVRAARILKSKAGTPLGADIEICKRIPSGGGLGGGSSDAASTLVGLGRIWGLGLGVDELAGIGLTLGADVPVFVKGRAAFATGVGEKLTPVVLEEPWYVVLYPGCPVATADIFNAPDLTRDTPPIRIHGLPRGEPGRGEGASEGSRPSGGRGGQEERGRGGGLDLPLSPFSLLARTGNDCEAVARRRYPPVDAALNWLSRFGEARMTGTGACVFAPFRERREAERVLSLLPEVEGARDAGGADGQGRKWTGFVARGRNRSPLNA